MTDGTMKYNGRQNNIRQRQTGSDRQPMTCNDRETQCQEAMTHRVEKNKNEYKTKKKKRESTRKRRRHLQGSGGTRTHFKLGVGAGGVFRLGSGGDERDGMVLQSPGHVFSHAGANQGTKLP